MSLHFVAVASGRYEIACVLFNMAAMQSQIGANQNPKADDGLKLAAKYFMVNSTFETHIYRFF